MVIKSATQVPYFTKHFDGGNFSHRLILPGRDASRVKVTQFTGRVGTKFENVHSPTDETVYLIEGRVKITNSEGIYEIEAGGVYYIPAGEVFSLEFLRLSEGLCVYSQAADGTLPENEPDPD